MTSTDELPAETSGRQPDPDEIKRISRVVAGGGGATIALLATFANSLLGSFTMTTLGSWLVGLGAGFVFLSLTTYVALDYNILSGQITGRKPLVSEFTLAILLAQMACLLVGVVLITLFVVQAL